MTVRTRIAPSPTGSPHIGTAYIALFNYAFARKNGGQFILRIEDTDQSRSTRESEQEILDALNWLGIPWDEGPDKGGPCGPYRQSERTAIYREHALSLVEKGKAYPCFCGEARLRELRRRQAEAGQDKLGYDGLCGGLDPAEAGRRMRAGEPHVIRLRVPAEGECAFKDRFREEVRIPWNTIDHQVLLKSDGFPTYHLANVVDDHLMGITHVIRGEEWISSTPKHLLIYGAFGWTPPEFAHLPLLRNPDKSKLSKRKNPTSILYYRRAGYLPAALRNYLGLLAYSLPDGRERFSLDDMAATFDFSRVSLGGPIFDPQKLRAFNGAYIRGMAPGELMGECRKWMLNDDAWLKAISMAQPRLALLSDLVPMTAFLFSDRPGPAAADLAAACGGDAELAAQRLKLAQWECEKSAAWNKDVARGIFDKIAGKENVRLKDLLRLFFLALSGAEVSLPIFDSMELLGRDMVVRRIQYALEALDAAGTPLKGKALKALSERYEAAYCAAQQG